MHGEKDNICKKCFHCNENLIQKDKKCEICGTSVAKINLSNRTRLIEFYICSKKGCEWNRLSKDYVIEIKIDDSLVCQFNKD